MPATPVLHIARHIASRSYHKNTVNTKSIHDGMIDELVDIQLSFHTDQCNNNCQSYRRPTCNTNAIQHKQLSMGRIRSIHTTPTKINQQVRAYRNTPAHQYIQLERQFTTLTHILDYVYTILHNELSSAELLNEIYNELVKHFKSNTQIDSNTINNIVNHAKTILASNH